MVHLHCVCASIPCLFPSYSLSRATLSPSLGSRIDGVVGVTGSSWQGRTIGVSGGISRWGGFC